MKDEKKRIRISHKRLKILAAASGTTVRALQRKLGISHPWLFRQAKGSGLPSDRLWRLAEILNVDVDVLTTPVVKIEFGEDEEQCHLSP